MAFNIFYISDNTQPNAGQIISYEEGDAIDPSTAPAGQSILTLPAVVDLFNGQPAGPVAMQVNLTILQLVPIA